MPLSVGLEIPFQNVPPIMIYSTKSCSAWAVSLILIWCFLSETACAAPAYDDITDLGRLLPPLERSERAHISYYSLPFTLEEHFNIARPSQSESQSQPDDASDSVPSLGTYVKEFVPDLWGGTKRIFSKDNVPVALIGLGLTGLAFTVDHEVKDYFQERRPLNGISKIGDDLGQGIIEVGVGASLLAAGEISNNRRLADTGASTLEALLVNGIATEGLKYAVERVRPNGQDNMSFPSGHVSMTATLASSISEMYSWDLRIAIPLYLITAYVGASRIQDNMHYLSDVFAGATLGTVIGMSFAKFHKEKNSEKTSWDTMSISPVYDKDLKGFAFTFKW